VAWDVVLVDEVEQWFLLLDPDTATLVGAAIDVLAESGPTLGRPLVDRIKGSSLHNLKELRPGSAGGSEIRILFVFDPLRQAVLLVAGDKAGAWKSWYPTAIAEAERRYTEYLQDIEGEEQ
jgi:hypothetical protein